MRLALLLAAGFATGCGRQPWLHDECEPGTQDCECGTGCDPGLACLDDRCQGYCGNGIVEPPEDCDLGESNDLEGECRPDCVPGSCGDGYVGPDEVCDEGDDNGLYGRCAGDCLGRAPRCGDGVIDEAEAEQCDDGNDMNGDGCDNACVPTAVGGWMASFESATASQRADAVAIDPSGDILVAGRTSEGGRGHGWIRRLAPDGHLIWTVTHEGPDGSAYARGVTVGLDGDVTAVGGHGVGDFDDDAWVARWDRDGNELWTVTHAGPSGERDMALGVAPMPDGGIVVTGIETNGDEDANIWVARYSSDGGLLWTRTQDGPFSSDDWGEAIAVDPDGNVIVVGRVSAAAPGSMDDVWMREYDGEGGEAWTISGGFEFPGNDAAMGVAADAEGFVACGVANMNWEGANAWVRALNHQGNEGWTIDFDGPASGTDEALGIALGPSRSIVIVGRTDVQRGTGEAFDAWVKVLDSSGADLWGHSFDGAARGDDSARAVAVDSEGGVVVVGATRIETDRLAAWVGKYPP